MNMFKPTNATSVKEYIAMLSQERREIIMFLHEFIQKQAPTLKPNFAANMLGYGGFKYRNYKNQIIDWPVIALASQKNYVSLYVCAVEGRAYVAEKYKADLGKVSVGKSCIRFKKIEDLNLAALKKVIQKAVRSPGLIGATKAK